VHFSAQLRTGAQAGKGANQRALAHRHAEFFAVDVGEGVDHRACSNGAVGNDAVGTDLHAFTQ
jgi:hypothetical protein